MDPGISSTGAGKVKLFDFQCAAQSRDEFPLHRPGILLDLPPAVAGPFIFDREFEPGHSSRASRKKKGITDVLAVIPLTKERVRYLWATFFTAPAIFEVAWSAKAFSFSSAVLAALRAL